MWIVAKYKPSELNILKTAIEDLKDSIEQFQMCEQKWLVLIANIELAIVYICDDLVLMIDDVYIFIN